MIACTNKLNLAISRWDFITNCALSARLPSRCFSFVYLDALHEETRKGSPVMTTVNENPKVNMLQISSPYSPLSFPGCEAPERVQELGCGCCEALVRSNPDWVSRGHFGGEVPEGFGGGWKTLPGYDSVGRALGSPVVEAQGHHWWESEDCCSLEVGLALVGVQDQTWSDPNGLTWLCLGFNQKNNCNFQPDEIVQKLVSREGREGIVHDSRH